MILSILNKLSGDSYIIPGFEYYQLKSIQKINNHTEIYNIITEECKKYSYKIKNTDSCATLYKYFKEIFYNIKDIIPIKIKLDSPIETITDATELSLCINSKYINKKITNNIISKLLYNYLTNKLLQLHKTQAMSSTANEASSLFKYPSQSHSKTYFHICNNESRFRLKIDNEKTKLIITDFIESIAILNLISVYRIVNKIIKPEGNMDIVVDLTLVNVISSVLSLNNSNFIHIYRNSELV